MSWQSPSVSLLFNRGPKYHLLAHTSLNLCHVQNSFRTHDLTMSATGMKALIHTASLHFTHSLDEFLWICFKRTPHSGCRCMVACAVDSWLNRSAWLKMSCVETSEFGLVKTLCYWLWVKCFILFIHIPSFCFQVRGQSRGVDRCLRCTERNRVNLLQGAKW